MNTLCDKERLEDERLTDDAFWGGRLTFLQPKDGFRAGMEAVILAAAAAPSEGCERWLDAGAGNGAAALCLAKRAPSCEVFGLELQADLVDLANRNADRNGLSKKVRFFHGDLFAPPPQIVTGCFDGVITNPPFFDDDTAIRPPKGARAPSCVGEGGTLADWVKACLKPLRSRGTFIIIQRADRLGDLLSALQGRAGDIAIAPLWPKQGRPSKLVLVKARKDAHGPPSLRPGLVMHQDVDVGRAPQTAEADSILRQGGAFVW